MNAETDLGGSVYSISCFYRQHIVNSFYPFWNRIIFARSSYNTASS